jgi:translation initiation factor 2B subunit (eIF-2B alpha/beta/delta family)
MAGRSDQMASSAGTGACSGELTPAKQPLPFFQCPKPSRLLPLAPPALPAGWLQIPDRPDVPQLQGWQASSKVHLLNLAYDLMPPDCVSVVVTEMGAVPPTSVAVILREAQRDSLL